MGAGRARAIGLQTAGKGIGGWQPATTDMEITINEALGIAGYVAT